jgi:phytoene dehydrogenase-like protein
MVDITNVLVDLAKSIGVKFHFQYRVKEILTQNQQVKGIRVVSQDREEQELFFDKVVSNMDVTHTYRKLLPQLPHPDKLLNQPKSSSGVIFYWGVKKAFPELGLHNILFSDDYREEFRVMFEDKKIFKTQQYISTLAPNTSQTMHQRVVKTGLYLSMHQPMKGKIGIS